MPIGKLGLALLLISLVAGGCGVVFGVEPPTPAPAAPGASPTAQSETSVPIPQRWLLPFWPRAPDPTATPTPAPAPPPAGLVVVTNEKDQSVTLIDAASNQVDKTIKLGAPARGVAIAPDGATAWVFSSKPKESDFYVVDLRKGEHKGAKRLRSAPYAVAFSADGRRAFVGLSDGSAVALLDATTRNEFGTVALGRQTEGVQLRRRPHALAVLSRPSGEVVYVAGEESGAVWALDAGSGALLAEIEVGGGPSVLLVSPGGRRVYALLEGLDRLVAIDPATQQVAERVDLPGKVASAALGPGGEVLVTGGDAGEVWVVEPSRGAVTSRIKVGSQPAGIALSPDGARAYVANRGDGTLSVIDVPTRKVVATLPVGQGPVGVAFTPPVSRETPTPAPTPPTRTPTPTVVPTPTRLPQGAKPAEHRPREVVVETFVPRAEFPVALAFAPDGRLFYAELRTGRIRIVEQGVLQPEPFYDFAVAGQPETGLLGLVLDPDFATNHYVYALYTEPADGDRDGGANGPNQLVRLTDVYGRGTDLTPIVRDLPSGQVHNAGSLRFGPDGKLYVTLGETGSMDEAQDLNSLAGKILRVNPDGSTPDDNPFAGQPDKQGLVWAYGFRNPFGLDFHPVSKVLVATESGPGDNDELNLVVRGGNYGWPPSGFQDKPGLADPIATLDPVVSPTGITFYRGDAIPEWRNDLFYCNFHQGQLRRIHLAPDSYDRIVFEEVVAPDCTLNVTTGPDGALYYSDVDAIYRLTRAGAQTLPAVAAPGPGDGTAATPAAQPAGTREEDRDVNIDLTEWRIGLSRSVVPAGKIRFLVENLGATTHAVRIVGNGVEAATEEFGPGESRLLEVELSPGKYQVDCPVGQHTDLGMIASLTVVGP